MGKGSAFLVGGALGAVAALLLTPTTGQQNREKLVHAADTLAGQGQDFVNNAGDTFRNGADKVSHRVQDIANNAGDNFRNGVQSVADQAAPVADDIRIKINEARDRIAEQVAQRRQKAKTVDSDVADVAETTPSSSEAASSSTEPASNTAETTEK